MQAISVKYLPPTHTKPSRLKASAESGNLTMSFSEALTINDREPFRACAEALIKKLGWTARIYGSGVLPGGVNVFTLSFER